MRTRLLRPTLLVVAMLALAAPTGATAETFQAEAPVKRAGITVGTGKAKLVYGAHSVAVRSSFVLRFRAPEADASWRARTALSFACARPGFDPSSDDGDDFGLVSFTLRSAWRTTHLDGTTGTLRINASSRRCPAGKEPAGSALLTLAVQDAAGTENVGRATLFAAG